MSAAFTPGPWVWVEGTDAINRSWNKRDWTIASVGNHRLGWHEDNNSEGREAGANARLIAAAPDLLKALRDLDDAYCSVGQDLTKEDRHQHRMVLMFARAAIAKATRAAA